MHICFYHSITTRLFVYVFMIDNKKVVLKDLEEQLHHENVFYCHMDEDSHCNLLNYSLRLYNSARQEEEEEDNGD